MPKAEKILGQPVNEEKWSQAKAKAAEEGHDGDWDYVMSIYKKMAHLGKSKKSSIDRSDIQPYNKGMRLVLAGKTDLDEFRCGHCKALLFKGMHLEKSMIEVKCRSCGALNLNN